MLAEAQDWAERNTPSAREAAFLDAAVGEGQLCTRGEIRLWNVALRQPLGSPMYLTGSVGGNVGLVRGLAFSPDGKTLAEASGNGTIQLWDVASRQPLSLPFTQQSGELMQFSPDGMTLASNSADGTAWLWDINSESWERRACRIADRNLTRQEWQQYLGSLPYHKSCPALP